MFGLLAWFPWLAFRDLLAAYERPAATKVGNGVVLVASSQSQHHHNQK